MSAEVEVETIPRCDFCRDGTTALYDAKLAEPAGPWAYLCQEHFDSFSLSAVRGVPLGTGVGQRLVLRA